MGEHLSARNIDFTLNGYDLNEEYLILAKERSYKFGRQKNNLVNGDFLEVVEINRSQLALNFLDQKRRE
jgi:hypothetical protein